jgi:hypothetical protein
MTNPHTNILGRFRPLYKFFHPDWRAVSWLVKLKSSWHLLFQKVSSAQIAAKNLFVEPKLRTSRAGEKGRRLSRNTSTGMAVICIVETWRPYSVGVMVVLCDCIRHSSIVIDMHSLITSTVIYQPSVRSIFHSSLGSFGVRHTLTARQAAKERQP